MPTAAKCPVERRVSQHCSRFEGADIFKLLDAPHLNCATDFLGGVLVRNRRWLRNRMAPPTRYRGPTNWFYTPEVPRHRAGADLCTALLRRAWRTSCAAQHAGAKRQPTSDFFASGSIMEDCNPEPARLLQDFSARGEHNFPEAGISMTRQVALS